MGAITIPAAVFEHAHDERSRLADLLDVADEIEQDWTASTPYLVTDEEIEQFIADVAAFGVYDDELGATKHASPLMLAVSRQWVQDKDMVGEIIGPAFWQQMKGAALLAKHGHPAQTKTCSDAGCCYHGKPRASTCACKEEA